MILHSQRGYMPTFLVETADKMLVAAGFRRRVRILDDLQKQIETHYWSVLMEEATDKYGKLTRVGTIRWQRITISKCAKQSKRRSVAGRPLLRKKEFL